MELANKQEDIAQQLIIKPYPHQIEAVNAVAKELKQAPRATLVMACGTGKTLVCLWVAEELKAKNVVVFLPSLALIQQTALEWAKAAGKALNFMAICSDQTVALDEDGIIVEKNEFWFPVLSDVNEIKDFLTTSADSSAMQVVFCTYQSSFTLAEAANNFSFSFGICDEAHRTAIKGESYFTAPLFDEYIAIEKRLFVTATPKQYSLTKRDLQDDFAAVISMDNPEIYGKHCHVLSFRKAIELDIISDYKIIFPEITSAVIAKELKLYKYHELSEEAVYSAAMQIAMKKALQVTNASKIITFHSRVQTAERFANSLQKNKVLNSYQIHHINGKQTAAIRKAKMQDFANKPKSLVTNARCLTEGIDAPAVDMVAILSHKKSKIDIIQAIGRALRKHPGKQCGYIMVPIFVDTLAGETYEEALAKPEARVLFELLLALEQYDELLCEAIRSAKVNEGLGEVQQDEQFVKFFDFQAQKYLSSAQFKQALTITIVDKLGSSWDKMYGKLVAFYQEYGHSVVSENYKNKQLMRWVGAQRQLYKKGKLSQNRIELLNEVKFVWDAKESSWDKMYGKLVAFYQEYGHSVVSENYKDKQLMRWVCNQRQLYKKGKLSQNRIELLNEVKFIWDAKESSWDKSYGKLVAFYQEYGHSVVFRNYKDKQLMSWVGAQRQLYKKGKLSQNKIELLNEVKFVWIAHELTWDKMYGKLKAFYQEYGHNVVSRNYKDKRLVNWVSNQRQLYKEGELSQNRIELLNEVKFIWDAIESSWDKMYGKLKVFYQEYGHNVSLKYYKDKRLVNWVGTQRQLYKKGKLSQSRIELLNEVKFVWDARK